MTATETTTAPATIDSKAPSVPQNRRSQGKVTRVSQKTQSGVKRKPGALNAKSAKPTAKPTKKATKATVVVKIDGRKNPAAFNDELFVIGTVKAAPKKIEATVWRQAITHQSGKGTRGERGSHMCPSGTWVSKCEMVRWAGAAGFSREQAAKLLEKCYLPMTAAVLAKYHGIGLSAEKADKTTILASIDAEDQKHLRSLIK